MVKLNAHLLCAFPGCLRQRDIIWLKHFVLTPTEERRSHALLLSEHNFLAHGVKEGGVAAEGLRTQNLPGWKALLCIKTDTAARCQAAERITFLFLRWWWHEVDLATRYRWCKLDQSVTTPSTTVDFPPIRSRPKLLVRTNTTANSAALAVRPVHKSRSG